MGDKLPEGEAHVEFEVLDCAYTAVPTLDGKPLMHILVKVAK